MNPIHDIVGHRPKMFSFEAVKVNPEGTTERFDRHRPKSIQRAAGEHFLRQQYLDQLHNPTENYALNRRLGCRLDQIYGIEVSDHSPTAQNFACHDPFLEMSAPVPTCHDPFLSMSSSIP